VRAAVETTSTLGEVQASSADRERLAAAMATRRAAVERVTDDALGALAAHDRAGAEGTLAGRRDEVRALVDRLSRHPELLPDWLAGTLRDLPEDDLGFSPFAGLDVGPAGSSAPAHAATAAPPAEEPRRRSLRPRTSRPDPTPARSRRPARSWSAPSRSWPAPRPRAAGAEAVLADAEAVLADAEHQLEQAREAAVAAERAVEQAEREAGRARQRSGDARRARDDARARFDELTG
jgi:hypothetical protein